jgi:hypothetical protein
VAKKPRLYFTKAEAEKYWSARTLENYQNNMAGSRYEIEEEEPGRFVITHFVIGQRCDSYGYSGIMPSDLD